MLSYLQGESQVYVFHMLVKVGFLPFFFSSSIPSMNKRYHFHIHTVVLNFASLFNCCKCTDGLLKYESMKRLFTTII